MTSLVVFDLVLLLKIPNFLRSVNVFLPSKFDSISSFGLIIILLENLCSLNLNVLSLSLLVCHSLCVLFGIDVAFLHFFLLLNLCPVLFRLYLLVLDNLRLFVKVNLIFIYSEATQMLWFTDNHASISYSSYKVGWGWQAIIFIFNINSVFFRLSDTS